MNNKITESQNPNSLKLDSLSTIQIIELINNEDSKLSLLIKEIIPITKFGLTLKVGGHSDASNTPNLPLVPAPT